MIQRITLLLFVTLSMGISSLYAQAALPGFSFYSLDGKAFTASNLDLTRPVFVMMFDPYCDHCQSQAETIAASAAEFKAKGVQFVWVTLEPDAEAIENFKTKYFGETGLTDLYFLQDNDIRFEEYFGYTDDSVNIYCYRTDGRQPKYFGKEQNATVLLRFL